jgi:hypothetical protein
MSAPIRWNLGACDRNFEGFTSIDICLPADIIADLAGPWPGEDSSVTEIRAWDIIEHIGDCDHISPWVCSRCKAHRKQCDVITSRIETVYNASGATVYAHLPNRENRHPLAQIHVMNEAYRVLQPGGIFDIEVPTTDGRGAFQDPTHRSYWNLNSFLYFKEGDPHRIRFGRHYGIEARFKVLSHEMMKHPGDVWKLKIKLEAVKR